MTHPALTPGRTAVITGAAGGIGLGVKIAMADPDYAGAFAAFVAQP